MITTWTCSPNFPNLFLSLVHFTTVYFFFFCSHRLVMTVKSHMVETRAGCATVSRPKQQQSASLEPCQLRDAVAKAAKQCQIISCSCNTTGVINAKEIHTCTLELRAGNDRSFLSEEVSENLETGAATAFHSNEEHWPVSRGCSR